MYLSTLDQLQRRIGELHKETNDSRTYLQSLYKQRVSLEKDREIKREEINKLNERIHECQLLKFGKVIDLDDLEQGYDKTKENDNMDPIKQVEDKNLSDLNNLLKEKEKLKDEIAEVNLFSTYKCLFLIFSYIIIGNT